MSSEYASATANPCGNRPVAFVSTRIPGWSFKDERSWREIMPWIIWPSVYTGLSASEHGILAFGQTIELDVVFDPFFTQPPMFGR